MRKGERVAIKRRRKAGRATPGSIGQGVGVGSRVNEGHVTVTQGLRFASQFMVGRAAARSEAVRDGLDDRDLEFDAMHAEGFPLLLLVAVDLLRGEGENFVGFRGKGSVDGADQRGKGAREPTSLQIFAILPGFIGPKGLSGVLVGIDIARCGSVDHSNVKVGIQEVVKEPLYADISPSLRLRRCRGF